jgi:hydroxymethylglutaryl-CoA reductase (NADPH)
MKSNRQEKLTSVPRSAEITADLVAARWRHIDASEDTQSALLDAEAKSQLAQYQHHIENFIGTVKLPVGIAGPLRVLGTHADGDYHVPLATTEAALVASYSRGARLMSAAGGCRTAVLEEAIGRAPGFAFRTLDEARAFVAWLLGRTKELAGVAAATSRYCRLLDTRASIEGNHVYVNFEFFTGDAAGQNMVTFATEAVMRYIRKESPVQPRYDFIEVNHCGDKKATGRALQGVRGRRVTAEVEISADSVKNALHTEPERMVEYWRMGAIGCALSGTIGIQGQYANALTAIYLACGQDVACAAESAAGITRFEVTRDNALYAAVTLPNVVVGTVGGGTSLPSQRASLAIMGLAGPGHAGALAEICAALCLAGEISLVGALCAGEFAQAHRKLARPVRSPTSIR